MSRKKLEGDEITLLVTARITHKRVKYLREKYGTITAALNQLYSEKIFNEMLAMKAAQTVSNENNISEGKR